jgi:hypothetical protein
MDRRPLDWHDVDPEALFEAIRDQAPPADAERMVWALERILSGARIDPNLLDHLAIAAVCALAYRDTATPRSVLERLFRRSIPDEHWQSDYASLLSPAT